jgi:hypothetical protein
MYYWTRVITQNLKTKMVDDKIEDEAVEICFRVVKTVEMVEFTTPAGKKKVVEAEEARQIEAIEENFVKANKTAWIYMKPCPLSQSFCSGVVREPTPVIAEPADLANPHWVKGPRKMRG